MVSLDAVRKSNSAVLTTHPITAVFVGATQGIGEYALRQLVAAHGTSSQPLRVYLVGRKEAVAEKIFADCAAKVPGGVFIFVKATDLALMKEVDRVSEVIIAMEKEAAEQEGKGRAPCIDLLVMTQAYFAVGDRMKYELTSEGLQFGFSLLYYSRMRFVMQLIPLLTASPLGGRVVSVFGGKEKVLHQDDLGMLEPGNLSFLTQGSHTSYMTTLFFERLASQHRGKLSLNHYFPGLVMTPGMNSGGVPAWFRILVYVMYPVIMLVSLATDECGQRVVYHTSEQFTPAVSEKDAVEGSFTSTDGIKGGGANRVDVKADAVLLTKPYADINKDELRNKVWEHTMKVFDDIAADGKFSATP